MRRGFTLLADMRPSDFVYFLAYALAGFVPVFSSFFFILLEYYGLYLQHLYEMFVGVWPSVRLFRRFHVLRPMSKQPPHIGGSYFQQRTKGSSKYIAALTPGRWDH
jgi:hypothetical protein